jgi:hypothetical protein
MHIPTIIPADVDEDAEAWGRKMLSGCGGVALDGRTPVRMRRDRKAGRCVVVEVKRRKAFDAQEVGRGNVAPFRNLCSREMQS